MICGSIFELCRLFLWTSDGNKKTEDVIQIYLIVVAIVVPISKDDLTQI